MQTNQHCPHVGCPLRVSRRSFLGGAAVAMGAVKLGLFESASSLFAAEPRVKAKPIVRVGFVRPNVTKYWMGWPGAAYDIKKHQKLYTQTLQASAKKHAVTLQVIHEPLSDKSKVDSFLQGLKNAPPDGLIVVSMSLNHSWPHINRIATERGAIPTIVFSPMGTSFTSHLQQTRNITGLYVAATQDVSWLDFGVRMLRTIWDMKHTRLCICRGEKTQDVKLNVIGTTLHYVPRQLYAERYNKTEYTDQVRKLAEHYRSGAKKVVEPAWQDILNSLKNYVVARQIMAEHDCHGISVDCLPLVQSRRLAAPPCMAWLRLNDEGSVGACEADWNAAISLRLISLLFNRPGFMQDPAPNTVNNTLMGAHCSCPTKLAGFDKPAEPYILRSHSESNTGVSPQVLWKIGQKVTIMKFQGPERIILGTGKVLRNIDTPPSGGCRTSVELQLDGIADSRDTKGFHQLFIYGDLELPLKAYCQLAGIQVEHI